MVSGIYKLKDSVFWQHQWQESVFSICHYFTEALEEIYYVKSTVYIQNQPPRGVPRKRYSGNVQQIYRRTPKPKYDFKKIASSFIEITLRHRFFPVNLLHIFRTCFLKNTSGWLPLELTIIISIISKTKLITTKNNCINKDKISKSQIKVGKIKIPFKLFNPYTCSNHQPWSA